MTVTSPILPLYSNLLSAPVNCRRPSAITSAGMFRILAAAIGECATNTVKHAGGVSLSAEIRESDTVVTYRLKTDGEAPRGPVREAGGLRSLRTLVESAGGAMRIEAAPGFLLTIQLPKGM